MSEGREPITLRLSTFNYDLGGRQPDGSTDLDSLIEALAESSVPAPADVHFLCETRNWWEPERGNPLITEVTDRLSELLPGPARYEAHFGHSRGTLLLTRRDVVTVTRWRDHEDKTHFLRDTAETNIGDVPGPRLGVTHWSGSHGRRYFEQLAAETAHLAQYPAIRAGDFNATSSADGERIPEDWGAICDAQKYPWKKPQKAYRDPATGIWKVDTLPIDILRETGWWDVGERAGDFTVTTNSPTDPALDSSLRIDRIFVSDRLGAWLIPGTYTVWIPRWYRNTIPAWEPRRRPSGHRVVTATIAYAPSEHVPPLGESD
jgi:endonuclease/exonuclease/phosphatase family metal-dependent hydrolase